MKVDEHTREVIGEILFKTISMAVKEAGQQMKYTDWTQLDDITKANYYNVVEQIVSQIPVSFGVNPEPVSEPVLQPPPPPPPPQTITQDEKDNIMRSLDASESTVIQSVVASHPGIEMARKPPARSPLACKYCGDVRKSKQAKTMHEKTCSMRPKVTA